MIHGVNEVGLRQMGVVGGSLYFTRGGVLGGFVVVLGGMFVMFSCMLVMFALRHDSRAPFKDFDFLSERGTPRIIGRPTDLEVTSLLTGSKC